MHSTFSAESSSVLRIGDYISIRQPKPNEGYICAEGIINDDCFVSKDCDYFEDCLWEIHVQYQYSALKEYELALEEIGALNALNAEEEENVIVQPLFKIPKMNLNKEDQEILSQLRKAALNEKRLNEKLMTMKKGKPVAFGDVIQLQHVKSKSFLTVSMTVLAKLERENMRVALDKNGSAECCLIFSPKYKHDREGQPINNNSELIVRAQERPNEFIHCSKKTFRGNLDDKREVNCSLETATWTVNVYQHANDANSKSILAGQLILLQEPETLACLTILDTDKPKNITDKNDKLEKSEKLDKLDKLEKITKTEKNDKPEKFRVGLSPPLQLSSSSFSAVVGTQYLWSIECVENMKGGPLQIRTDKIIFRALNTGYFMQLSDSGLYAVKDRKYASIFEISYAQSSEYNTLIEGVAVQLQTHGKFIVTAKQSTSTLTAEQKEFGYKYCIGQSDRNTALCLVINAELYHTIGVDMHVGVDATKHLKAFANSILQKSLLNDPLQPIEAIFKALFKTLDACCQFLNIENHNEHAIELEETSDIFHRTSLEIVKMRQTMMREQGFVDTIMNILDHCTTGLLDNIELDTFKTTKDVAQHVKKDRKSLIMTHSTNHLHSHTHTHNHTHNHGHNFTILATKRLSHVAMNNNDNNNSTSSVRKLSSIQLSSNNNNNNSSSSRLTVSKQNNNANINLQHLHNKQSHINERNSRRSLLLNAKALESPVKSLIANSSAKFMSNENNSSSRNGLSGDIDEDEEDDNFDANILGHTAPPLKELDDVGSQKTVAQDVAHYCLKTLLALIKLSHTNQIYVADRFPLLLRHAKDQPLAVACVQEMLHDNVEVLHTKVREREINMLVQLLVDSDMDVTFLKLIQSTCSMGFDTTQGFVTEALFGLGDEDDGNHGPDSPGKGSSSISPAKIKVSSDNKDEIVTGMVGFPQFGTSQISFNKKLITHNNENEHAHTPKVNIRRASRLDKINRTTMTHGNLLIGGINNNSKSTTTNHLNFLKHNALNAITASHKLNDLHLHHGSIVSTVAGTSDTEIIPHLNLVIKIETDRSDLNIVEWCTDSKYIPLFEELMLKQMYGYGLLVDGVPKIYVHWPHGMNSKLNQFSMKNTFGHNDHVPIEMIFHCTSDLSLVIKNEQESPAPSLTKNNKQQSNRRPNNITNKSKSNNKFNNNNINNINNNNNNGNINNNTNYVSSSNLTLNVSTIKDRDNRDRDNRDKEKDIKDNKDLEKEKTLLIDRKMQISHYLVTQLYLVADLCLNRQYVAMGVLENLYEYDSLLALLRLPNMPNKFKAPVCRIIRCLYVDREPQVEAKFPRLIRTSISLGGGEENSFSDHHSGSPYAFALLQELISHYIHNDLNSKKCDVLSGEMMHLLHALMKFGFYYTPLHLKDTVVPLIKALGAHREVAIVAMKDTTKKRRNSFAGLLSNDKTKDESDIIDVAMENGLMTDLIQNCMNITWFTTIIQFFKDIKIKLSVLYGLSPIGNETIYPDNINSVSNNTSKINEIKNTPINNFNYYASSPNLFNNQNNQMHENYFSQKELQIDENGSDEKLLTDEEIKSIINKNYKRSNKYFPWRIKKFTDSLFYIGCVMFVVLFAVTTSIIQLFFGKISEGGSYYLVRIDYAVAFFFITELLVRLTAHILIFGKAITFWNEIFNILDTIVVILDIIVLSLKLDPALAHAASIVRFVRIIRASRLIRVLRAAKLVKQMNTVIITQWTMPTRYKYASPNEVKTIVGILRILTIAMDRIQDQKLGTAIKAFVEWVAEDKQHTRIPRTAMEVYQKVSLNEVNLSADIPNDFDQMLIDVLMYNNASMVQEALQLLMIYKSADRLLCEAMGKVQIIYSPKVEQKCKEIISMLRDLKRMGDMYEIWGSLETTEDKATAEEMSTILHRMEELIVKVVDAKTATADELFLQVDEEVQQLLLNLDAMSTFMTLQNSLYDGGNEPEETIKNLWIKVNDIICLYVYRCPANQEIAFKNISWFVARVNDGVGSSKVVRAIVKGNRDLIKSLPRHYIGDFAKMILSNGRKPEYLDLFVGVVEPVDDVVVKVKVVQNEIVKYLTSREWKEHLVLWCDGLHSEGHNKRKTEMLECSTKYGPDVDESELSPDLLYHVKYLTLLANCNLGPKLLAMYGLEDVLSGIIDATTIFPVRKALANVFLEMVSSDVLIPGIEISHLVWQFFEMVTLFFEISENDLSKLFRTTTKIKPKIQRIEWLTIVLKIVTCFFDEFEFSIFNELINRDDDYSMQLTTKTEGDIVELITRLYTAIVHTRNRHSLILGEKLRLLLNESIDAISGLLPILPMEEPELIAFVPHDKAVSSRRKRDSITIADIQQVVFREQFIEFAQKLTGDAQQLYSTAIELFERIPLISDNVESDVRLESLIQKLCNHIRSMIIRKGVASRSLEHDVMDTVAWLIKTWRLLLEKYLKVEMEYYCRTPNVDVIVSEKGRKYQQLFNTCGVTYLCLELISVGIDHNIVIESIYLLVALLIEKKGNETVQIKVAKYLCDTDSTLFFQEVAELIEQLTLWSSREFEGRNDDKMIDNLPNEIGVFKLLQLLCLGNFAPCQNCIRDQFGNTRVVALIPQLATYSDVLSRLDSHLCTQMSIHLVQTIHALMQGPCKGNQEQFVLQTELLLSLNRIIRDSKPQHGCSIEWYYHIEKLKECCVDVLRAAIEDQAANSVILERVATSIELSVLHVLILPLDSNVEKLMDRNNLSLTPLQSKYLVFRYSLREKTKASAFSLPVQTVHENGIACVEVVWNNEVHRHYFHIPDIVNDLSAMTKEMLYSAMDSPTHEMQLREFLKQARNMYIEATNQKLLRLIGIGNIAKWKTRLLKFMLINACVMNIILVVYYFKKTIHSEDDHTTATDDHATTTDDHATITDDHATTTDDHHVTVTDDHHRYLSVTGGCGEPVYHDAINFMASGPKEALMILNIIQCILAFGTLLILTLVHIPTKYRSNIESGIGYINAIINTICDPIPLWYSTYFVFTMLGLLYNPLFLTALLLDFVVLDSTTRDVLFAVTDPWRQILSTMALIGICSCIFAAVIFQLFWKDMVTFSDNTLWDTLKVVVAYGVRGEYGISHEMTPTIDVRVVMDVLHWVIVLEILRSVFHAIIIDGFGKLRELKMERMEHVNNSCFLCGIERHEFERFCGPGTHGFTYHRETTHNLLFYVYFVVRIWSQSIEEDDGIEMHVRKCMEIGDVSWCPNGISSQTIEEQRGIGNNVNIKNTIKSYPHNLNGRPHSSPQRNSHHTNSGHNQHGNNHHQHGHGHNDLGSNEDDEFGDNILMEKLDLLNTQVQKLVEEKLSIDGPFTKSAVFEDFENNSIAQNTLTGGNQSYIQSNANTNSVHDIGIINLNNSKILNNEVVPMTNTNIEVMNTIHDNMEAFSLQLEKMANRIDKLYKKLEEKDNRREKLKHDRNISPEKEKIFSNVINEKNILLGPTTANIKKFTTNEQLENNINLQNDISWLSKQNNITNTNNINNSINYNSDNEKKGIPLWSKSKALLNTVSTIKNVTNTSNNNNNQESNIELNNNNESSTKQLWSKHKSFLSTVSTIKKGANTNNSDNNDINNRPRAISDQLSTIYANNNQITNVLQIENNTTSLSTPNVGDIKLIRPKTAGAPLTETINVTNTIPIPEKIQRAHSASNNNIKDNIIIKNLTEDKLNNILPEHRPSTFLKQSTPSGVSSDVDDEEEEDVNS